MFPDFAIEYGKPPTRPEIAGVEETLIITCRLPFYLLLCYHFGFQWMNFLSLLEGQLGKVLLTQTSPP